MENRSEANDPRQEELQESDNRTVGNFDHKDVSGEPGELTGDTEGAASRQEERDDRQPTLGKNGEEGGLGLDSIELEEGDNPAETGRQSGDRAEEQHEPLK